MASGGEIEGIPAGFDSCVETEGVVGVEEEVDNDVAVHEVEKSMQATATKDRQTSPTATCPSLAMAETSTKVTTAKASKRL